MRSVLELNNQDSISLGREIDLLKDYLELEKLRFEERFEYQINCPQSIKELLIPPMILQPFVENAIIHGFAYFEEGGLLEINFTLKEEKDLHIEILDNGIGISKSKGQIKEVKKKSMALQLTRQRFKLLSEDTERSYFMELSDRAEQGSQGTRVLLKISRIMEL